MSNMMSVEKRTKRAAEAAPMKYVVYSGRMLSGSRPASALLDYRREVVTEQHVEWRGLIFSGDRQTCQ